MASSPTCAGRWRARRPASAGDDLLPDVGGALTPGTACSQRECLLPDAGGALTPGTACSPPGNASSPTSAGRWRAQRLAPVGEDLVPDADEALTPGTARSPPGMPPSPRGRGAGGRGGPLPG